MSNFVYDSLIISIFNVFRNETNLYEVSDKNIDPETLKENVEKAYEEAREYARVEETFHKILNKKYGIRPVMPFMNVTLGI